MALQDDGPPPTRGNKDLLKMTLPQAAVSIPKSLNLR
jgi:hypothetical protein